MIAAVDPERKRTLPQFRVEIDGSEVSPEIDRAITLVVIDERLHTPAMFEIHFQIDPNDLGLLDNASVGEGKEMEILTGYASEERSLCIGKVTSLDIDLDEQMPRLIVRGYDLSYALHRDVKSRSFVNQSDSDIVQKIAGEAGGLNVEVEQTSMVHEYVLQHSKTNYEFLLERAHRIGYEARVDGRKLQFQRPAASGSPTELTWGVQLKRFRPRLSVASQVDEVEIRGWDPGEKQAIIGTATSSDVTPEVGETRAAGSVASGVWGSAKRVVSHAPVESPEEATTLAKALYDELTSGFIEAAGECQGDPKLRVGASINVLGVGERFGGTYRLTAVRHELSKTDGYQVSFTATTLRPETLASMLADPCHRPAAPHVVTGIVTNNQDPEKQARVKVRLPTLFDNDETAWARLSMPMAGADRGFLTIPEVNDEVVVAFEHGDPNRPFVLGSLWNGVDAPPEGNGPVTDGSEVTQRVWRSRSGHVFIFDDKGGSEAIHIIDKTGNNRIVITSKDNRLEVSMDGDIDVTSKTGKINVSAEKDVVIESRSGKLSLRGITAELEADQSAKVKAGTSLGMESGTSLTASAGTSAEVKGATSAKLEGATASVQGQTMTNIKGGIVNIN